VERNGAAAADGAAGTGAGPAAAAPAKKKKLSFAERREYESLFPELDALEAEKTALEALFGKAGAAPAEIRKAHERYGEVLDLIEAKTLRWEDFASGRRSFEHGFFPYGR